MDQEEFVQVLIRALSNEGVIKKLQNAVCGPLQKEVGELRDLIKEREDKIRALEDKVHKLENRLDDLEQYSRRNSLRISGVTESGSEDITDKVTSLFNDKMKLSPPVTPDMIDRVHRVGPKKEDRPRAILIKFATYRTRNHVFRSRWNLKQPHQDNLNVGGEVATEQIKKQIFINEDLTRARSNLLFQARQLKKNGRIQDCWSWDGTILIKNNVAKIIPISSVAELERMAS